MAGIGDSKTVTYINLDEVVDIYVSFKEDLEPAIAMKFYKARTTKQRLKFLLLHQKYGLHV